MKKILYVTICAVLSCDVFSMKLAGYEFPHEYIKKSTKDKKKMCEQKLQPFQPQHSTMPLEQLSPPQLLEHQLPSFQHSFQSFQNQIYNTFLQNRYNYPTIDTGISNIFNGKDFTYEKPLFWIDNEVLQINNIIYQSYNQCINVFFKNLVIKAVGKVATPLSNQNFNTKNIQSFIKRMKNKKFICCESDFFGSIEKAEMYFNERTGKFIANKIVEIYTTVKKVRSMNRKLINGEINNQYSLQDNLRNCDFFPFRELYIELLQNDDFFTQLFVFLK